ncbi:MAG: histidine kinase [Thermaerobacter sp.]|nr:histidine kinase [Thermaerobacter sp.]
MIRGDNRVWRIVRWVVLVVPVAALALTARPAQLPGLLGALALSAALAIWGLYCQNTRWFRWGLALETGAAALIAWSAPNVGVFAPFVVAADTGYARLPVAVSLMVDGGLAAIATRSVLGGQPWTQAVPWAIVFFAAMVGNTYGITQTLRLNEAYAALSRAREREAEYVRLKERERIAQNLHDVMGHSLTLIVLKAELLQERLQRAQWDDAKRQAGDLLVAARRSLDEVRSVVRTTGQPRAIREMIDEAEDSLKGAGILVKVVGEWPDNLSPGFLEDVGCMLREAVTNVLRHAQASRVVITLTERPLGLTVADDGAGLRGPEGSGLSGMRSRTARWGGTFRIGAGSQRGTQLDWQWKEAGTGGEVEPRERLGG